MSVLLTCSLASSMPHIMLALIRCLVNAGCTNEFPINKQIANAISGNSNNAPCLKYPIFVCLCLKPGQDRMTSPAWYFGPFRTAFIDCLFV